LTKDIPRKRDTRCVWTPFLGAHTPKRMCVCEHFYLGLIVHVFFFRFIFPSVILTQLEVVLQLKTGYFFPQKW
jgi:hypothetical protein